MLRRIVTGIQPSGVVHIGNYVGVIKPILNMQKSKDEIFLFIADLHALTAQTEPEVLKRNINKTVATLLACGLDPNRITLFRQSHISCHSELYWLLMNTVKSNKLSILPQWKNFEIDNNKCNMGGFTYPVLQSADILLHQADIVPTGEDQLMHIHFARDLAYTFNKKYGQTFKLPEAMILESPLARLKSLRNPSKKMSKSDMDQLSFIGLIDSDKEITKKIKKSVTDSIQNVYYSSDRPGLKNLLNILLFFKNHKNPHSSILKPEVEKFNFKNKVHLKNEITECLITELSPIRNKYFELLNDSAYLENVLQQGAIRAESQCVLFYNYIKSCVGL